MLLKRLKKKDFKAHELAFMKHQQLFEKWKALIDAKIERDNNAIKIDESGATDEYHVGSVKIGNVHFINYKRDQRMSQ